MPINDHMHGVGKLDEHKRVVPCSTEEYCEVMHPRNIAARRVGLDTVNGRTISTVFLAMDHSFGHGTPQWFETLMSSDAGKPLMWRYETWQQAEEGHAKVCDFAKTMEPTLPNPRQHGRIGT